MNNESLRKHLAEKVMGWRSELSKITNKPCKTEIYVTGDDWIECSKWDPPNNIAQAMECLYTFEPEGWEMFVEGDVKKVVIFNSDDEMETEVYAREEAGGSLTLAISLACAHATGWEE